jgi:hypothetical protein
VRTRRPAREKTDLETKQATRVEQKLLVCVWGDGPLAFLQDDFNHRGGL